MAAGLAELRPGVAQREGLHPTNIMRDLYQIAGLVELSFAGQLDSNGRAAIREMKSLGAMGPLLFPLLLLDKLGTGIAMGYVWRSQGRVVGNVSMYPAGLHPDLGRGWFVANVAVHPDHRRQGIARQLMEASLADIRRRHGKWVSLQVEADNEAAQNLYDSMGFVRYETLEQWQLNGLQTEIGLPAASPWEIRPRELATLQREVDLVFRRARRGGMAWTRTLALRDMRSISASHQIRGALEGVETWVQIDPVSEHMVGAIWLEHTGWRRTRISLFLDPLLGPAAARRELLQFALGRRAMQNRIIRLETTANDPATEELLQRAGFFVTRRLVQMRLHL